MRVRASARKPRMGSRSRRPALAPAHASTLIIFLQLTHLLLKLLLVFLDLERRQFRLSCSSPDRPLTPHLTSSAPSSCDVMFAFIFKHIFYLGGLTHKIKTQASQPLPEVRPRSENEPDPNPQGTGRSPQRAIFQPEPSS